MRRGPGEPLFWLARTGPLEDTGRVPPLVRRYIKTSFVFLIAGLLLGGYVTVAEFLVGAYPPRLFVTAHVHLLLVGFMLMIVMGVATWMFPRPGKDDPRYRPELAETVYWTMTVATALRAVAEVGEGLTGAPALRVLITLASLGQFAGAGLFVVNIVVAGADARRPAMRWNHLEAGLEVSESLVSRPELEPRTLGPIYCRPE